MASIGFISHDFDREKNVHNISELLEFSLVDVPANPGAEMQRSVMIKSMAEGIKKLNCKEVEAYVCKKGDSGCKIYSKIMEEIKKLEEKEEENSENKPPKEDISNDNEENNTDNTDNKLFYEGKDLDLNFLKEIEKTFDNLEAKIKGEEEIIEEEKKFIDIICEMGLLLKKKNDIIEETSQELSKAEKPLQEKINQLDDKIKDILHKEKTEEEKEEQTNQLIKLAAKSLNLALSRYNNKK